MKRKELNPKWRAIVELVGDIFGVLSLFALIGVLLFLGYGLGA